MSDPQNNTQPNRFSSTALRSKLAGLKWLGRTATHAVILTAVFVGGIALIGLAQRTGWIGGGASATVDAHAEHTHAGEQVYTCPMHSQIRQNEPGDCPICGMDLVPAGPQATPASASTSAEAEDEGGRYICPMMCTPPSSEPGSCPVCGMDLVKSTGGGGDGQSVSLEPADRRVLGIQTAKAELGPVFQSVRTVGSIDYDESQLATISAYVGGRLEKLFADYVGVPVRQGDDLALIYSPDLYSAQVEYLTALENSSLNRLGGRTNLQELSRQNLIELGVTEKQIADLRRRGSAQSRMRIKSPITGTVIAKHQVEGDYVKTGDKIYRVADLSTVWLMLDLYPDDAARVRFGQQVEAEIQSMPGEVFTGRVAFVNPTVDSKTRTVSVRVEMLNPDGKLKPGDYATARVYVPAVRREKVYDPALADKYISPMHPQVIRDQPGDCPVCGMDLIPTSQLGYASEPLPQQQLITVPRDAVLMAGNNSVVYVETEPGRFEIRRVTVGPLTDQRAVIIEGLSAGETVATDGNFLIDSQMQLAGNPSLMDPSRARSYPPGPLELPENSPIRLTGTSAEQFDRAYNAYLTIQQALAADETPPPIAINNLDDALQQLIALADVPDQAQVQLARAERNVSRLEGSLENARRGFRVVSHALLRAATEARGDQTAENLIHVHCPMVPGGGGDWIQTAGDVLNPYWGGEMLRCGEKVHDLSLASTHNNTVR